MRRREFVKAAPPLIIYMENIIMIKRIFCGHKPDKTERSGEMVKHIVMWTVKEGLGNTKEQNAVKLKEMLEALKEKIPFIKKLEVGINYAADDAAYDVVLYSEFESRKDLEMYIVHPDHQALKDFIINIRDKRCFVDYEC